MTRIALVARIVSEEESLPSNNHAKEGNTSKSLDKLEKRNLTDQFSISDEFRAYEKYARWQAQTLSPFIDYFALLDIGIPRWEKSSFGKLSEDE